jgi:ABC-2 type transport system permease protein
MNGRAILTITKKDLTEVIRNSNIFVSMFFPFLLWAIFTYVIDLDRGNPELSRNLFIMFAIMCLGMTGSFVMPALLVEEREKKTLQYLLTTPAGILDVLLAKLLVSLVFGVLITAILLLLERIQVGNFPAMVLLLFAGSLFMTLVGLLIGILFSTMQQVNTWATAVVFLLIAPSWFSSLNSEMAESIFFKFFPTYYMMRGLGPALQGEPFGSILLDALILLGSAFVTLLLAVWLLERKRRSNAI